MACAFCIGFTQRFVAVPGAAAQPPFAVLESARGRVVAPEPPEVARAVALLPGSSVALRQALGWVSRVKDPEWESPAAVPD